MLVGNTSAPGEPIDVWEASDKDMSESFDRADYFSTGVLSHSRLTLAQMQPICGPLVKRSVTKNTWGSSVCKCMRKIGTERE